MTVVLWMLAVALVVIGLVGIVVPAMPGTVVIFAGLLLGAWADGFMRVGVATIAVIGVLGAASYAIDFVAAALGVKRQGASRQAMAGAGLGTFFGLLFGLPGLIVVYSYFQIPLMVIVFMPALEGLRPQWREAATNLGASTWQFWRMVGFPLLTPAFLGSALLLFANAFAAYATAAVLVSQGNPITPLFIRSALTSEILLGQQNLGFALALEMIVVVSVVMGLYALLLRRTSRWLR